MVLKKQLALFVLGIASGISCFSQVYNLGFNLLGAQQEGQILQQGNSIGKLRTYWMPAGRLDVYQPFLFSKTQNVSFGIEAGLSYAYFSRANRETFTYENEYIALMTDQKFFSRSFGALQFPLQVSVRSGRFSNVLQNDRRSFGISAGAQLITFYLPDERGTMISPCFSVSLGILQYLVLRAEFLTRAYQSEYQTTLEPIARLRNSFNSISLSFTLK